MFFILLKNVEKNTVFEKLNINKNSGYFQKRFDFCFFDGFLLTFFKDKFILIKILKTALYNLWDG